MASQQRLSVSCPSVELGARASAAALRVLITTCVHGNEQCGMEAVNQEMEDGGVLDAANSEALARAGVAVKALVGNPGAVAVNARYRAANLNRILKPERASPAADDPPDLADEKALAAALMGELAQADAVLDLHSTSAASPSFALPMRGARSRDLALSLPVAVAIEELAHATIAGGTSLDFMLDANARDGKSRVGVTVECGQHTDPESVVRARAAIIGFLRHVTATAPPVPLPADPVEHGLAIPLLPDIAPVIVDPLPTPQVPLHLVSCHSVEVEQGDFHFQAHWDQFAYVPHGTHVCTNNGSLVTCSAPDGAFIIMPARDPVPGEEAFFWGLRSCDDPDHPHNHA